MMNHPYISVKYVLFAQTGKIWHYNELTSYNRCYYLPQKGFEQKPQNFDKDCWVDYI